MSHGLARLLTLALLSTLVPVIAVSFAPPAEANNVTATGTSPAICNQTVGNPSGVSAYRLAGGDCIVEFKNSSSPTTWTVPQGAVSTSILIVGGGGGAGFGGLGGGGGGGQVLLSRSPFAVSPGQILTIRVGSGGTLGYRATEAQWTRGGNGESSTVTISGSSFSAVGGGGGGGSGSSQGGNGGSGGGGSSGGQPGLARGNTYTTFFSYETSSITHSGAGAGGAGAESPNSTKNGGAGVEIWGLKVAGGGGGWPAGSGATTFGGGSAGGGTSSNIGTGGTDHGVPGTDGTGGGGGGGERGGSGIVAFRYTPDVTPPSRTSATLMPSGNQIQLAYNESLSTVAPAVARFSVSDSGTSRSVTAASVSDSLVTLTLSATITTGRVVTITYDTASAIAGNFIEDLALNDAASFSNVAVTNNSTVLNPLTTPTTLAVSATETNTATFTYTPTTNASSHTLRLYDSATSTLLSTTTSFTSGSSLSLLTPATQYYATLQAVGNGTIYESSTASSPLYFTTLIRSSLITVQPIDTATTETQNASFSVTASARDSGTLTYQWQQSTNAGVSFADIPSANAATLSISSVTSASNGYRYRVIITNSRYSVSAVETSTAATLTVNGAIALSGGSNLTTTFGTTASSSAITASGGTGSITFSLSGSTTGLSINSSSGIVTTNGTTPRGTVSLTITATDASGATATQAITVTITTGLSTITLSFASSPKKGTTQVITATTSVPGTVRFLEKGRVIPSCTAKATSGTNPITATCSWKPKIHGPQTVTATLTPSSGDYASARASESVIVTKRTSQRS